MNIVVVVFLTKAFFFKRLNLSITHTTVATTDREDAEFLSLPPSLSLLTPFRSFSASRYLQAICSNIH